MSIFDRFINIIKGGSNNTMDDRISPALFRPVDAYIPMGTSDVAKVPILPMHFRFMYDLYYYSDVLRTVIRAIIWEVFRNGIEIKKKFISKCTVCGKEYGEVVEVCEDCGSRKIRQPNWRERLVLEKYLKDANLNDQSLVEVLKDIAVDIAVTDNAFLVVVKEYEFDENGEVVGARPVEVIRGSPLKMRLVMNRNGRMGMTDDGKVVAFCLNHRNEYKLLTQDEMKTAKCDKCGCKLFPAYYKMESGGIAGGSSSSGTWGSGNVWSNTGAGGLYYTDGEVLHIKLFTTGIGYGHSPILSIWLKVMILMKMDWFVLMAYHFQRPPKGLLILRGNRESIAKSWEWLMEQARTNPHMIMPLVVEGTQETGARRVAEFLDLTVKSNDIDFIAYRDELRKSIGAMYGVMPLWQGDTRGGLSNEGLQITVTNRTVEMWHRLFNDNVLKWLIRQLGVEDYIIQLRPNEMRDEYSRLELEMKKVQLASALKALGYKPILAPDAMGNIEFKFEKADIEEQLREILMVVGNQYNVSPDDLYSAITERIAERVNSRAAAMAGGHEVVGQVGEGGGEQGVEPDTPISEILENLENEDEKTHEHARAEGEPKGMRPRRYDQRYEGEPQLPRR